MDIIVIALWIKAPTSDFLFFILFEKKKKEKTTLSNVFVNCQWITKYYLSSTLNI